MPSWGNATLLEILWTLSSVFALILAHRALIFFGRYIEIASDDHDAPDNIAARKDIRTQRVRLVNLTGALFIGIYAITQPSSSEGQISFVGLAVFVLLLWLPLEIGIASQLDVRDRKRLDAALSG